MVLLSNVAILDIFINFRIGTVRSERVNTEYDQRDFFHILIVLQLRMKSNIKGSYR